MKPKTIKIFWVTIFIVGVVLLVVFRSDIPVVEDIPLPGIDTEETEVPGPDEKGPQPETTPSGIGSFPPAECSLSGSLVYLNPKLFETRAAKIVYKNIDHPSRLVNWTIVPDDDVSVSPNLFAQLQLPHGEGQVGAIISDNPVAKAYKLMAEVTYGQFDEKGAVVVHTAQCGGHVDLRLDY